MKYQRKKCFLLLFLVLFGCLASLTQIYAATVKAEKSKPNLPQLGSTSSKQAGARQKIPSLAVVYTKITAEGFQIVWRDLASSKEHIVYKTEVKELITDYSDALGYLPSPDGQWLVIWDYFDDYYGKSHTLWSVIRLADSKVIRLADKPGRPELLPYWKDSQHLILEGAENRSIFDTSKKRLLPTTRLAERPSSQAQARLMAYCNRYYAKSWQVWNASLKRLEKQLDLERYYDLRRIVIKEPLEYMMLRSIGIPGLGQLRHERIGEEARARCLACSPDGKLVAFADHSPIRIVIHYSSGNVAVTGAGARLRVFGTESQAVLWDTNIPLYKLPHNPHAARSNPPRASFTSPVYRDIRFDQKGRFLSFTTPLERPKSDWNIKVIDALTFKEALKIENASNAFIIPLPRAPAP